MDWADLGNAAFEITAALVSWKNVGRIRRDKEVRGVYWPAWLMFTAWGWWNIFYYGPNLGQWFSWGAGLVLVAANTTWVIYAIRYRRN